MRVDWCVSSWFRIKNTHSQPALHLVSCEVRFFVRPVFLLSAADCAIFFHSFLSVCPLLIVKDDSKSAGTIESKNGFSRSVAACMTE